MKKNGMTLLESMAAHILASSLTMVALPFFASMIDKHRVIAITDTLNQHIEYARSEAIKRNQPVEICARSAGGACDVGATMH